MVRGLLYEFCILTDLIIAHACNMLTHLSKLQFLSYSELEESEQLAQTTGGLS